MTLGAGVSSDANVTSQALETLCYVLVRENNDSDIVPLRAGIPPYRGTGDRPC